MAIIDIPNEPGPIERKFFGLIVLLFTGLVGWFLMAKLGWHAAGWILASVGLLVTIAYYAIPALQNRIYRGWLLTFFPLGFVMSHVVLGAIYYLLFTPIAILRRLLGGDPLQRAFDPEAKSYWIDRDGPVEPSRYFKQY